MKALRTNRWIALITVIVMAFTLIPTISMANTPQSTAYVIVENTTFSEVDGAPWSGRLLDMYPVELEDGDTMMSATVRAMQAKGIEQTGAESNYISTINGLSEFGGGGESGWMVTLNDWFISQGAGNFYAADGDIIRWMYTSNGYGEDLGGSWSNNITTLSSLAFSKGTLNTNFSGNTFEYTLTLPSDANAIQIIPTATNKNFQTRIYKNATVTGSSQTGYAISSELPYESMLSGLSPWTGLPSTLDYYKRTQEIPVAAGDVITVACGLPTWNSMNSQAGNTFTEGGCVYTINIVKESPAVSYDVTVKVAPSTANVNFYMCDGFNTDGYDIPGSAIVSTDGGVNSSYHIYTMSLPKGTYSFRGTDADGNSLGGMTFDVPTAVNVDGTGGGACEIVLRQTEVYTTTKVDGTNYATAAQYSTKVTDANGKVATAGSSYISTYTKYRYLLYAGGNAELYSVRLIPTQEVTAAYNLGTNTMTNYTVAAGTTTLTKSGTLPVLLNAVINVPSNADARVFNQLNNFCNEEVSVYSSTDKDDGTKDCLFKVPTGNGNHTYRVSMPNKITKAGYLNLASSATAATTITFAENEDPKVRPEYDTSTALGKRMEDNILMNINNKNSLRMNTNETFKVRAYRAAWQIINSDTANIMIEPDFHYQIIKGDSVTFTQSGQNAVLTAVKPGVSVIEVTYDAIHIGGNTSYGGLYGAIDPARHGLFVVNVDGDTSTAIDWNIGDWDCEMDTVYFTGTQGEFTFKPTSNKSISVKANDAEIPADSNGFYAIPVFEGNNIVEVSAGDTTEYMVLKGNKLTVNIANVTNPNQPLKQGDTVKINFKGLHMPVPKFSGIYNPGFGGTMKVAYKTDDGGIVSSKGTQYDFINNHDITFTVWEKGAYKLTEGYMPMTMMCNPTNPWGQHRTLTDSGVGANFNASAVAGEFSKLPYIEFNVLENTDLSYLNNAKSTYCQLANVNILYGNSTYAKSFSFAKTTQATASIKNSNTTFTSISETYPLYVSATPVNSGVTMEFRYWEEGDATKHTVALTAGTELNLGTQVFSGTKTINMEIAVTPINPIYGGTEVYSYVVYKDTSGFERPLLKTLNVNTSSGTAFGTPYAVLYSDNGKGIAYTQKDYYCYVPKNTQSVTLSIAKLIGSNNITINGETKTVGTSAVNYSTINLIEDETTIQIPVTDGSTTRTYTVKVIKANDINVKKVNFNDNIVSVITDSAITKGLTIYITAYNNQKLISCIQTPVSLVQGENNSFVDYSSIKSDAVDSIKVYVWDENMMPYTNTVQIK